MRLIPRLLDLTSGTVALVGAGSHAVAMLRLLRSAGATVRWYADNVDLAEEVLLASAPPGHLELSFADPLRADFFEFTAVVAAAGGRLDQDIAARARANGVPVNVVDRPDVSTFSFSDLDRGAAVGTIRMVGANANTEHTA
jgi:uroporphyrin-III C-methyltransferase/precorrin-2 dehydrogenase/sirohydrochlorin ferrochelatase